MAKQLDIKSLMSTYGTHVVKVIAKAEGFRDSDPTEVSILNKPLVAYDGENTAVVVTNILSGITAYDLYIDSTLAKSYTHDGSVVSSISIDLTEFSLDSDITYDLQVKVTVGADTFESDIIQTAKILGVSGLYDSATTLTRTDNAVGLSYAFDSSTGAISSDFDNEFPYNEMERVTMDGNVMVKVPAMYFRIGTDSDGNITDVAVAKVVIGSGDWYHTDEFYYGAYNGTVSSNVLKSTSGTAPTGNINIAQARSYATANGTGYQQLDLYHKTIMNFLWWIEFADKNSQSLFPMTFTAKQNTGGTDSLTTPSGFLPSTYRFRWHYIEDYVGNMREFLDGVYYNYYASADASIYGNGYSTHNQLSYTPNMNDGCIASYGWDSNNPFLCMPKTLVSNSNYDTYFCDRGALTTNTTRIYYVGESYDTHSSAPYGVSYVSNYSAANYIAIFGARLLYCPA
ncbi:MAG: hypothetical protein K6A63_02180 [Acholeplasmatales bacterium]|nr:hypothetical protein [Acholeplasmatales bacterium]